MLYTAAVNQATALESLSLNVVKTVRDTFNATNTAWTYNPITNTWSLLEIKSLENHIVARDGFYLVLKNEKEIVNGAAIDKVVVDTYYFDAAGNMITGWIKTYYDKTYFFKNEKIANEGKMAIGWLQIGDYWYFFTDDGVMYKNAVTPDGHVVDGEGKRVS